MSSGFARPSRTNCAASPTPSTAMAPNRRTVSRLLRVSSNPDISAPDLPGQKTIHVEAQVELAVGIDPDSPAATIGRHSLVDDQIIDKNQRHIVFQGIQDSNRVR